MMMWQYSINSAPNIPQMTQRRSPRNWSRWSNPLRNAVVVDSKVDVNESRSDQPYPEGGALGRGSGNVCRGAMGSNLKPAELWSSEAE